MSKGWTAADINRAVSREGRKRQEAPVLQPPRPPDPPPAMLTPPAPAEARSGPKTKATPEQQRPARLRPVFGAASWPGGGWRWVAHGASLWQRALLDAYAARIGLTPDAAYAAGLREELEEAREAAMQQLNERKSH